MPNLVSKKNISKSKILTYMLANGKTSKVELAKDLNLSMPTVLSNVNELMELGMIEEVGEYESTGGRKARTIAIRKDYKYAVGVAITAKHIVLVLVNMAGEVMKSERTRITFSPSIEYYNKLSGVIQSFLSDEIDRDKILGIGVSLPGIIQSDKRILSKSHALQLENYSLKMIEQVMPYPVYFENDANASMLAENIQEKENVIYLSLNNTLGGAICINGELFSGENKKAGEFGHMIIVPDGKKCYCGKLGCADAYCASSVLTENGARDIENFMSMIGTDKKVDQEWHEYLDKLAILISNLRMAYHTDIILGGEIGAYVEDYKMELGEKIFKYNLFDKDLSYLRYSEYKKEASAVGIAKHFLNEVVKEV